jgi:hypothetical protein
MSQTPTKEKTMLKAVRIEKDGKIGVMQGQKADPRKFGVKWEDGTETVEYVDGYFAKIWKYVQ